MIEKYEADHLEGRDSRKAKQQPEDNRDSMCRGWECSSVQHCPSMYQVLGSVPSTARINQPMTKDVQKNDNWHVGVLCGMRPSG